MTRRSDRELDFAPERRARFFHLFFELQAPLALLDAYGRVLLHNSAYVQRFSDFTLPSFAGVEALEATNAHFQTVSLIGWGQTFVVNAARAGSHVLVAFDAHNVHPQLELLRELLHTIPQFSAIDPLTGAWSRDHLDAVLVVELARSVENRQPVTLMMLRIDDLDQLLLRMGPGWAEPLMRELAQTIRAATRGSDMLFRWSGECFALLVASAGYRRGGCAAENLRKALKNHRFHRVGELRVSLGVAEHDKDEPLPRWCERLEAALGQAQRLGGDRVYIDRRGHSDHWPTESDASILSLLWHEAYESGESHIDEQHRELFRLANRVIDVAVRAPEDRGQLDSALGDLLVLIERHFADEELLLERLNYLDLPEHRRAHDALLRRARRMRVLATLGKVELAALIGFLVQDVVARHLLGADTAFFPLVRTSRAFLGS